MWLSRCACTQGIKSSPKTVGAVLSRTSIRAPYSTFEPHRRQHRFALTSCPSADLSIRTASCITSEVVQHVSELPPTQAQRQTIYALSTPPGKAGVAVIRVSGSGSLDVWRSVTSRNKKGRTSEPVPWRMEYCHIIDPHTKETLDDALVVFFKAPHSFSTEDVLELHIHSGRAIISSVLSALSRLPYCRPAEAGEFTRRAFEGGRLNLTQVEGLDDLINAQTNSQRRVARQAAEGEVGAQFEELRQKIIECQALAEAIIDFGDEEQIEDGVLDDARRIAHKLCKVIQGHLSDSRRGEILRSGIRLAIFGPPNAGKSSLLNFLAQREAAIVTPVPGTTRDVLELSLDIGGFPVIVSDTAGLRKTEDVVEQIGVERAHKAVNDSDVSICVLPLPEVMSGQEITVPSFLESLISSQTHFLLNKADLCKASASEIQVALEKSGLRDRAWTISLHTGDGASEFLQNFAKTLSNQYETQDMATLPLVTRARHRNHLESALCHLNKYLSYPSNDIVLAAEELRYAAQDIGKISGIIRVDDVLDSIFRNFCIGK